MFNSFFLAPLFSVEQQWQAQALRGQVVAAHVVVQPFCSRRPLALHVCNKFQQVKQQCFRQPAIAWC